MCSVWQHSHHDAVRNLTAVPATFFGAPTSEERWPALQEVIVVGVLGFSTTHVVTNAGVGRACVTFSTRALKHD